MKFDARQNPAACAAHEETRYSIDGFSVRDIRGATYAVSTNGRTLLAVPVDMEPGDHKNGVYPSDAIAEAARYAKASRSPVVTLAVNGKAKLPNGAEFAPLDSRFPDAEGVVPRLSESIADDVVEVCVNVALLAELCDGLGTDMVRLRVFTEKGKKGTPRGCETPIVVEPLDIDTRSKAAQKRAPWVPLKGFGVIMPIGGAS